MALNEQFLDKKYKKLTLRQEQDGELDKMADSLNKIKKTCHRILRIC